MNIVRLDVSWGQIFISWVEKGEVFWGPVVFYCRVLKISLRKMFAATSRHTCANCQCNDENVIFNEWVILLNGIIKSVITVCELFYQLGNCSNNAGIRISLFLRNSIYHNTIFFFVKTSSWIFILSLTCNKKEKHTIIRLFLSPSSQ